MKDSRDCRSPDIWCCVQVDVYIKEHFGFIYAWRGWVILVLLAFVLAFRVGAIVAVTKLSFVKR